MISNAGGKVKAESTLGIGSCFKIYIKA